MSIVTAHKRLAAYLVMTGVLLPAAAQADDRESSGKGKPYDDQALVEVGPRPYYLIDRMSPSPLKDKLEKCADGPFYKTNFSIGHRGGGTMQFPEHSKESHVAGSRMGAGIQECDVTFTKDGELVCRHDQCDLHTTTNILLTPLASKCTKGFSPAQFDATGKRTQAASALCCTSDLTVSEFKTLSAKMDSSDANATTPEQYQGGVATWRTELYNTGGTLLTHKESIKLIDSLGSDFTPELKSPNRSAAVQVEAVFGSQAAYAQKMIDDYKAAGIKPKRVWAQSFLKDDILYWVQHEPAFGKQAAYLDDANVPADVPSAAELQQYAADGIRVWAPPTWVLLAVKDGKIVASQAAKDAKAAGLQIITWTLERSGRIVQEVLPTKGTASPSFYYQSTLDALTSDGDIMVTLHVLAKDVGILGIFSDWAGTVSYYASCMGLK